MIIFGTNFVPVQPLLQYSLEELSQTGSKPFQVSLHKCYEIISPSSPHLGQHTRWYLSRHLQLTAYSPYRGMSSLSKLLEYVFLLQLRPLTDLIRALA